MRELKIGDQEEIADLRTELAFVVAECDRMRVRKLNAESALAAVEAERDELRRELAERPTVSEFEKRTRSAEASAMELLEIVDIFDPSGHGDVEDVVETVRAAVAERDHLRKALDEKARAGAGVALDLKELVDERDELKRKLNEARAREEKHVTIAQDAADRLRHGIETLRDEARAAEDRFEDLHSGRVADRLDAILRGES